MKKLHHVVDTHARVLYRQSTPITADTMSAPRSYYPPTLVVIAVVKLADDRTGITANQAIPYFASNTNKSDVQNHTRPTRLLSIIRRHYKRLVAISIRLPTDARVPPIMRPPLTTPLTGGT